MTHYTVLGAGGYLGGHMARYLRQRGEAVRTPARDAPEIFVEELGRVIYCVGLTGDFIDRPLDTVDAHVGLLTALLRRARLSSLVYLSSTRLYDSTAGLAHEDATLVLDPRDRRHIYDLSKATGEALCHAFPHRQLVIARLSSVFDDALGNDTFLNETCRKALELPAFEVETSPEIERDYIHVDDVCAALFALSQSPRHRVYNVASGVNLSNRALIELVGRETGCTITLRERPADRSVPRIDVTRLGEEFQIFPAPPQPRLAALLARHRRQTGTPT